MLLESKENQQLWVIDMCLRSVTNAEVARHWDTTTELLGRWSNFMVWSTMCVHLVRLLSTFVNTMILFYPLAQSFSCLNFTVMDEKMLLSVSQFWNGHTAY